MLRTLSCFIMYISLITSLFPKFSRSNHSESITHEAVKKDQEAVSNRVKSLLMSDDIDEGNY